MCERLAIVALTVAVWVCPAAADRLTLLDGRVFVGTVVEEDQSVLVFLEYGSVRFDRSEIARIEYIESPLVELDRRQAEAGQDANAVFELAHWARQQGLTGQAKLLLLDVVALDPNHAGARHELGQAYVAGQWKPFESAIELCRSRLQAGGHDALLEKDIPELLAAASGSHTALKEARRLLARTQLAAGLYDQARESFSNLARQGGKLAIRHHTIANILLDYPDGMYVLTEPYPPAAILLGDADEPAVGPGPGALSDPLVLAAALRDRARECLDRGKGFLSEAIAQEPTDPTVAKTRYAAAERQFDRADAIVPAISRSYRVEIGRRRIVALRKSVTAGADKFDSELNDLGQKDLPAGAYRAKIVRMVQLLDRIRSDLKEILAIAKPYGRELVLEVKWAQIDLDRMDRMRLVLGEKLDEKR